MNCTKKLVKTAVVVLLINLSSAFGADNSFKELVDEETLRSNMAYGQLIELNQYSPGHQKGLMLRLFAKPVRDENCGLETGSTCKNQHLITVATLDEMPEVQAYALKAKGEFVKADWVIPKNHSVATDEAELVLTFRQYHRFATRANRKLPKTIFQLGLKITKQGIEEIVLPQ